MEVVLERHDWVVLSEMVVDVESVIRDLRKVDATIWVETVDALINKLYPGNGSEKITLVRAGRVVKAIAKVRKLDMNHPAISHYSNYTEWNQGTENNSNQAVTPVSEEEQHNVIDRITYPEYRKSTNLGDKYDGQPCYLDQLQMDQHNWLLAWSRMKRKQYSVSQLQAIIAESQTTIQLIAASLIWAEANPSEEVFEQAAKLAAASDLDDLWEAYYVTPSREGFVAVVLAIVHYDLLATLKVGEYFPWIQLIYKEKEYWRQYPKRKHN